MRASHPSLIRLFILFSLTACQSVSTSIAPTATPIRPWTVTSVLAPTAISWATPLATSPIFSTPHPILSDVRVRQAMAYCTDRNGLIRAVYPWLTDLAAFEADSFIPRGHWAYSGDETDMARYPFDLEQGQALLDETGWKVAGEAPYRTNALGEALALTLTTTDAKFRQTWAATWEEQMKACGIHITRNHRPAEWFYGESTGLSRRDFELAAFAWVAEPDLGGLTLYRRYACDQIPSPDNHWQGQNYSGWCNAAAEGALKTLMSNLNSDEQRAAYQALQREFAQEVPSGL